VSLRRRQLSLPPRVPVLIVCEGVLETSYFSAIQRHPNIKKRFNVTVQCVHGGGHIKVVEETRKRASGSTLVWCIFDVEDNPDCPQLRESLQRCQKNKIKVGLSNPCFNVWAIAHLNNVMAGAQTPDSSLRKLKSLVGGELDVHNRDWVLNKIMGGNDFSHLDSAFGNITCCKIPDEVVRKNPSTSVGELVQFLTEI
jgi:hypothetical protein